MCAVIIFAAVILDFISAVGQINDALILSYLILISGKRNSQKRWLSSLYGCSLEVNFKELEFVYLIDH